MSCIEDKREISLSTRQRNARNPGYVSSRGFSNRNRRYANSDLYEFDQNPLTFRRPPVAVLPESEAVGTALVRIALLIAAADEPGWYAAYSAAAPLTCGVAIDVPL